MLISMPEPLNSSRIATGIGVLCGFAKAVAFVTIVHAVGQDEQGFEPGHIPKVVAGKDHRSGRSEISFQGSTAGVVDLVHHPFELAGVAGIPGHRVLDPGDGVLLGVLHGLFEPDGPTEDPDADDRSLR